ncbi:hypothetical protein GOP47_0003440 [Adiantum capillus-veneris]|uniref:Uncharacterized protein n=1 Tax=Adiantum capillus-veneris TaxID=13818 RepID=A0A9D4VE02_ADICA|nr:hypothetical protein GOP47_0003440 [Adiantum capillus-veneris]
MRCNSRSSRTSTMGTFGAAPITSTDCPSSCMGASDRVPIISRDSPPSCNPPFIVSSSTRSSFAFLDIPVSRAPSSGSFTGYCTHGTTFTLVQSFLSKTVNILHRAITCIYYSVHCLRQLHPKYHLKLMR